MIFLRREWKTGLRHGFYTFGEMELSHYDKTACLRKKLPSVAILNNKHWRWIEEETQRNRLNASTIFVIKQISLSNRVSSSTPVCFHYKNAIVMKREENTWMTYLSEVRTCWLSALLATTFSKALTATLWFFCWRTRYTSFISVYPGDCRLHFLW